METQLEKMPIGPLVSRSDLKFFCSLVSRAFVVSGLMTELNSCPHSPPRPPPCPPPSAGLASCLAAAALDTCRPEAVASPCADSHGASIGSVIQSAGGGRRRARKGVKWQSLSLYPSLSPSVSAIQNIPHLLSGATSGSD